MMAVANNEPNNLQTLENQLRELSHDDRVFTIIQDFADRLGKTKDRQFSEQRERWCVSQLSMGIC